MEVGAVPVDQHRNANAGRLTHYVLQQLDNNVSSEDSTVVYLCRSVIVTNLERYPPSPLQFAMKTNGDPLLNSVTKRLDQQKDQEVWTEQVVWCLLSQTHFWNL
jgi:hypothetical protein